MKTICSWCGLLMHDGPLSPEGLASHGMCSSCENLMNDLLEADQATIGWAHGVVESAPESVLEQLAAGLSGDELQGAALSKRRRHAAG